MNTVVVWSDIGCPYAHAAVSRLHRVRTQLGLDGDVRFDHRAFPLELFNERPTPKPTVDEEVAELSHQEPDAGWHPWQRPDHEWPVTTLPALEAVQAAKAQGLVAGEQLDRALRLAFFRDSRCISLRSVILDVAATCDALDRDELTAALDDGRARRTVVDHYETAEAEGVKGSPHLFFAGDAKGTDAHNPDEATIYATMEACFRPARSASR